MPTTAILELGNPKDANAWEKGCQGLGIGNAVEPIRGMNPPLDKLLGFVRASPDWIFFSGHFADLALVSEVGAGLVFAPGEVTVFSGNDQHIVKKGTADFGLDRQCKVTIWGGCSVCHEGERGRQNVSALFHLLGPHVLLGYAGGTGVEVTANMLGAGDLKSGHFFDNVKGKVDDPRGILEAWLKAAIKGYRGGDAPLHGGGAPGSHLNERLFRAVDPDGREWYTEKGKIVGGRTML